MAGRWVSRYGRCPYDAVDEGGGLNAMVVIDDGACLYTDDAKRRCSARQVVVIYPGGALVPILCFSCNRWWSSKEYVFYRLVNWRFAYTMDTILIVTLLQLSRMGVYFLLQCSCEVF